MFLRALPKGLVQLRLSQVRAPCCACLFPIPLSRYEMTVGGTKSQDRAWPMGKATESYRASLRWIAAPDRCAKTGWRNVSLLGPKLFSWYVLTEENSPALSVREVCCSTWPVTVRQVSGRHEAIAAIPAPSSWGWPYRGYSDLIRIRQNGPRRGSRQRQRGPILWRDLPSPSRSRFSPRRAPLLRTCRVDSPVAYEMRY